MMIPHDQCCIRTDKRVFFFSYKHSNNTIINQNTPKENAKLRQFRLSSQFYLINQVDFFLKLKLKSMNECLFPLKKIGILSNDDTINVFLYLFATAFS